MKDPIVEEVREVRRKIYEECGRDMKRLIDRLKAAELNDKDRLVTLEQVRAHSCDRKASV